MPLKRQYGFIFNKTNIVRTLAHELGHGVFGLQHPFTEYNTSTTTDLLMDYGTGVTLRHNDWQVLHAPGVQLYPFIQGDSDGEFKLPSSPKCSHEKLRKCLDCTQKFRRIYN